MSFASCAWRAETVSRSDFSRDIRRPKVGDLASHFDSFVGPYLIEMGFSLINDPSEVCDPYYATRAIYASAGGLHLAAGFNPMDGVSAWMSAGRQWIVRGRWFGLSSSYHSLAEQLGLTVPEYYALERGEKFRHTLSAMLDDLKATLPIVLARVTLEDLLAVEAAESGARSRAARYVSMDASEDVNVSAFDGHGSGLA